MQKRMFPFEKNYDGLETPMLHTKFCGNPPTSPREDFLKVFIILYGCGGHFDHVTKITHDQNPVNKLSFPLPMEASHKIST